MPDNAGNTRKRRNGSPDRTVGGRLTSISRPRGGLLGGRLLRVDRFAMILCTSRRKRTLGRALHEYVQAIQRVHLAGPGQFARRSSARVSRLRHVQFSAETTDRVTSVAQVAGQEYASCLDDRSTPSRRTINNGVTQEPIS